MKYGLTLPLILSLAGLLAASKPRIHCYSCSMRLRHFNEKNPAEYNCAANVSFAPTVSCPDGHYCLTQFAFSNGALSQVRRTCQNPYTDRDPTTNEAPTKDGCITRHSQTRVLSDAVCYYHCTSNLCNALMPETFQSSFGTYRFQVDHPYYLPIKKCVQCNSETDEDCENKTDATICDFWRSRFCVTSTTTRFGYDTSITKRTVIRGCSPDQRSHIQLHELCKFAERKRTYLQPYITYSCVKFCAENGCNAAKPKEVSKNPLRCVVCSGIIATGLCTKKKETSRCSDEAAYCRSTLTYYVTTDQEPTQHKIASIKRECSSKSVKPACSTKPITGIGLSIVTCEETCTTSGCNVGWPARPRCSECTSINSTIESDSCSVSPAAPSACTTPAHTHCFTKTTNTESSSGYFEKLTRGCSISDIGTLCTEDLVDDSTTRNCHTTCDTDGCNQGVLIR